MAMVDQTPRLLRIGIGDHIRCAVLGRAEQRPLDGRFPELPVLLAGAAPAAYRIVPAHGCDFDGWRPTRLVFQNGALLLSLIVVPRLKLESLYAERYRRTVCFRGFGHNAGGKSSFSRIHDASCAGLPARWGAESRPETTGPAPAARRYPESGRPDGGRRVRGPASSR